MRRSLAFVFLFAIGIGCGTESRLDTAAAEQLVRRFYANVDLVLNVEEPEYADIPKIPQRSAGGSAPDRPAACGARVRFTWRDGSRTTHDDWVVWVTSDHKAIAWTGNASGDNWRPYVRSFAKE